MTRRKLLCLSLPAALLLALGAAWWAARPPEPGVTGANYQRLRLGMAQEEVEAILGPPNGTAPLAAGVREPSRWRYWAGPGGEFIDIKYGADGTACLMFYREVRQARPLWTPWSAPTPRTYSDRPPTCWEMVSAGDWPF